eukprot:NODE_852_length_1291_cov_11.477456_g626_i0.p1 GENE.NODE_852_length_1291_cov_11.477456_g626_i0~~NODE_852_length_1291_cov_11.477456_g626_i0.p1  ORF type:complete len:381 (+),score=97.57 NODE_852_length_1291_cov_11.477456_g626_i0:61-1203(+)
MEYLEGLQVSFPEIAGDFNELNTLYNQSFWHELTLKLLDITSIPQFQNGDHLVQLYTKFIRPIAPKLQPLSIAKLVVQCSKCHTDTTQAQEFLSSTSSTLKDNSPQAYIFVRNEEAVWKLRGNALKEAKVILEESHAWLSKNEAEDVQPIVHASYYKAQAEYLKVSKQYDKFYQTALLYLVYSDIEKMPLNEQQDYAYDIGIAALLGEKVYNFGELLGNPVVQSLNLTNRQWLHDLLMAFNKGDLQSYETLTAKHGGAMDQVLKDSAHFLVQKIRLMALLNYLFNLTVQNTVVPFQDVAACTKTPLEGVEHLLLKALALGIIKGIIDQVAGTVSVTWVQARVLDRDEITALAAKVAVWSDSVRSTLDLVSATSQQLQSMQ